MTLLEQVHELSPATHQWPIRRVGAVEVQQIKRSHVQAVGVAAAGTYQSPLIDSALGIETDEIAISGLEFGVRDSADPFT